MSVSCVGLHTSERVGAPSAQNKEFLARGVFILLHGLVGPVRLVAHAVWDAGTEVTSLHGKDTTFVSKAACCSGGADCKDGPTN